MQRKDNLSNIFSCFIYDILCSFQNSNSFLKIIQRSFLSLTLAKGETCLLYRHSHCSLLAGWGSTIWTCILTNCSALDSFLQGNSVSHSSNWVLSLQFLKFSRSVLVKELIKREETSTNLDLNLVFDTLDIDLLCTELINSLRLSHEHDLKLLSVWVVVDILSQFLINNISLNWNVHSNSTLKVNDVLAEIINFILMGLQLLQHIQLLLIGLVVLCLQLKDVLTSSLELGLKFCFGSFHFVVMRDPQISFRLNILLLNQFSC